MKNTYSKFNLVDGGMGTNLKKIGWSDIPAKAPFSIENKVHELFKHCDTYTTNTFAIDAAFSVKMWKKVINLAIANAKKNAGNKLILISISELANRELAKILVTCLTDAIKKSSAKNIMILFETFTSINTVHIMLSELDKISCDKKYKTCIVSGTYNFRTLNDGTTPSEFATYCNRYDFVHMVGQNCCDVATDIEYILKEYISSTNKLIFCKPNTDAINTNNLAKYIRQYNCSIGGFCCGSTPILTSALKKKLCDYKVNTNRTSANISTYPMTILQYGGIVGDRINTTKNKELTEWIQTKNWQEIARLALTQKAYGANLIDVNISCPQEKEIIGELFTYLQENTDCKYLIDSTNPDAIMEALKVYKGVPIINSINYDTAQTVFQKFNQFRPIYVFMTMKNGKICDNNRSLPFFLNVHNTYIDCCVESLDVNPNAFINLNTRINKLPYEQYRILIGISNISHNLRDRKIIDCAAYESLKDRCAFIAKIDNVKYYSKAVQILNNIPNIKRLESIEDYIINGVIPNNDILNSFLSSMSKSEIEAKILESLNFIGLQFEKKNNNYLWFTSFSKSYKTSF